MTDSKSLRMTNDWVPLPPRQLTGKPYAYHAYVGHDVLRNGPPRPETAWRCAKRAARRLNRVSGGSAEGGRSTHG